MFHFFWKGNSPLSNFHKSGFMVDGIHFTHMEQYMMYQKAVMFGDGLSAPKILQEPTPHEQKQLGRDVRGFDREVWYSNCNNIIIRGLYAKFTQNPKMGRYLVSTGKKILVEASPNDQVWGIGLEREDPRATQPHLWREGSSAEYISRVTRNEEVKVSSTNKQMDKKRKLKTLKVNNNKVWTLVWKFSQTVERAVEQNILFSDMKNVRVLAKDIVSNFVECGIIDENVKYRSPRSAPPSPGRRQNVKTTPESKIIDENFLEYRSPRSASVSPGRSQNVKTTPESTSGSLQRSKSLSIIQPKEAWGGPSGLLQRSKSLSRIQPKEAWGGSFCDDVKIKLTYGVEDSKQEVIDQQYQQLKRENDQLKREKKELAYQVQFIESELQFSNDRKCVIEQAYGEMQNKFKNILQQLEDSESRLSFSENKRQSDIEKENESLSSELTMSLKTIEGLKQDYTNLEKKQVLFKTVVISNLL